MSRKNKPTSVSQRHINQYVKCIGFGQYSVQYHVLKPRLIIILASRRLFTLWVNEWPVETHGVMLWPTPLPISDTVDQRLAKIHPHWSRIARSDPYDSQKDFKLLHVTVDSVIFRRMSRNAIG